LLDAIESYTGEEVQRFNITADDYKEILSDTELSDYNWKKLMAENDNPDEWDD
jgi:hypothetical protein